MLSAAGSVSIEGLHAFCHGGENTISQGVCENMAEDCVPEP